MTRLPALRARAVIQALERAGYFVDHVTGSHHILYHLEKRGRAVSVPEHRGAIPRGTLRAVIRQAGFTREEFLDLL